MSDSDRQDPLIARPKPSPLTPLLAPLVVLLAIAAPFGLSWLHRDTVSQGKRSRPSAPSPNLRIPPQSPAHARQVPPLNPQPPPGPGVVTNPDWVSLPDGDTVERYYPLLAQFLGRPGKATLACEVAIDGRVINCRVVFEDPKDFGFGKAAIRLSGTFRMKPKTIDGRPVPGGQVRIPIVFTQPKRDEP